MKITCPGCGIELELPPEAVGRHLLCDACNTKFEVELSATRVVQQPKIISKETKRPYDKKQLDNLAQSKGLKKFYLLFILAPASIKFIATYIFCMFVLDLVLNSVAGHKPSTAAVLYLMLCFPLLKRKDKAWRALFILCCLSFGISIFLIVESVIFRGDHETLGMAINAVASTIVISIPICIALQRQAARQWACN